MDNKIVITASEVALYRLSYRETKNAELRGFHFFKKIDQVREFLDQYYTFRFTNIEIPKGWPPMTWRPHHVNSGVIPIDIVALPQSDEISQDAVRVDLGVLIPRYPSKNDFFVPSMMNTLWLQAMRARFVTTVGLQYEPDLPCEIAKGSPNARGQLQPVRPELSQTELEKTLTPMA